ncbi:Prefoldin subunit 3 [Blattella germanica]|nr:Prefoldin subunit 3 [Blattella germanica]
MEGDKSDNVGDDTKKKSYVGIPEAAFVKRCENPKEIESQFMLSEQVYVKAVVPPTDKVCLWLGANVMLEYTLQDAMDLLVKNIESAKKNLGYVEHDLDFLRDQFTTTEVNMARVYNWDVKKRQAAKTSS